MQSEKQDNFTALACSFPQRLTAKDTELYFFPPPPRPEKHDFCTQVLDSLEGGQDQPLGFEGPG